MKTAAELWIDHRQVVIVSVAGNAEHIQRISSNVERLVTCRPDNVEQSLPGIALCPHARGVAGPVGVVTRAILRRRGLAVKTRLGSPACHARPEVTKAGARSPSPRSILVTSSRDARGGSWPPPRRGGAHGGHERAPRARGAPPSRAPTYGEARQD
jgi:hypothetical protein